MVEVIFPRASKLKESAETTGRTSQHILLGGRRRFACPGYFGNTIVQYGTNSSQCFVKSVRGFAEFLRGRLDRFLAAVTSLNELFLLVRQFLHACGQRFFTSLKHLVMLHPALAQLL